VIALGLGRKTDPGGVELCDFFLVLDRKKASKN